ncbi:MAG TPA: hypothetical protein VGI80_00350, partial [Pyrinomonadaceae bacterium]
DLFRITANKKTFRFKYAARPLIEFLNERKALTVDDLVARSNGLDSKTVSAFIKELLSHGLVTAPPEER